MILAVPLGKIRRETEVDQELYRIYETLCDLLVEGYVQQDISLFTHDNLSMNEGTLSRMVTCYVPSIRFMGDECTGESVRLIGSDFVASAIGVSMMAHGGIDAVNVYSMVVDDIKIERIF